PIAWWPDRQILARRELNNGNISQAYSLVADTQLTDGAPVAEAEFLAGWIAFRFLRDPERGLKHFTRLYDTATLPLSLSRGAYWAGRASAALDKPADAASWYEKASTYPTTYYGQLAIAQMGLPWLTKPAPEPKASAAETTAFNKRDLVRVVRILAFVNEQDRMKPFMNRLSELAKTPADHALIADMADDLGRLELGVAAAKRASYRGITLTRAGYPIISLPEVTGGPEHALLLALIRQESAFETGALSPAGARGLMQLMPATANQVAKSLQLPYSPDRLTSDGIFNVTLGQAYFGGVLNGFNGSYVLAVAGYNAGPGRVRQWVRDYGDPRQTDIDVVDWVEQIPFNETRNYVQRVLEGLQVYRLRIGDPALAFSLPADLRR
ncbi:MAG TPA: lytic transglycosylase domain-containing protein, partial [Stellaceae bacterium]|nr:lytic transglycosylase domain-containing protein [Stellaceae bacterium]